MKKPDDCNGWCIMKRDLGCYECYTRKPNLIVHCDEAPNISDIEAYELERKAREEE